MTLAACLLRSCGVSPTRANRIALTEAARQELLRQSFPRWLAAVSPSWTWDWPYQRHIQAALQRVTDGEVTRLMLSVPPRHGKSEQVTIRYPVWRIEREPGLRVIQAAYNQTLAATFSRKSRRVAQQRGLPLERMTADDWQTTAGGGVRAVGVGVGVTGHGGNLIVIDDPVKSREEAESATYRERVWDWYTNDLYTRLEPGGSIILIQTRWHEDDLAGRILASDDAANWTVVNLPAEAEANDPLGRAVGEALCPARFDVAALAGIRQVLGSYAYAALYQGRPQPAGGAIFKREWWAERSRYDYAAYSWPGTVARWLSFDTALKDDETSDYTAFGVYELTGDYRLLKRHAWWGRVEFPQLATLIEREARFWDADGKLRGVVIEDKGSGTSALQTLRQSASPAVARLLIAFQPVLSKEGRARQASLWCERGRVLLPAPNESVPWLFDWEEALFKFPSTAHDDTVDEFTQIVLYLENYLAEGYRLTA